MAYVVFFDTDDSKVKAQLASTIKDLGAWAALTSQSYLLKTSVEVRHVMETLQPIVGPNDSLWVLTAQAPWSGYGDPIVDDHLHNYLGDADDYVPRDWNGRNGGRP